jgi:hypothetical protein
MAIRDLLGEFENEESLPVDLNRIAEWTRNHGFQDEIEFIGVDLDIGVIRGFLHRFRYQKLIYGDPINCAHIYYARNQEPEWINMVCAKELAHLVDGSTPAKRKEEVENLFARLSLPNELKHLLEDPEYAAFDKFGDAFGAAILLPKAARSALLDSYNTETITPADIARLALIPVRYVRIVMSERWDGLYDRIMKI